MPIQDSSSASNSASLSRPALYLDIDGILLQRTHQQGLGAMSRYEIASGATEFLDWAVAHFDVFWLSTRTSDGNVDNAERAFRHASPSAMQSGPLASLIRSIPAAQWSTAKINGIESARPFLWIDDDPDPISLAHLDGRGWMDRLINVSADRTPDLLSSLPSVFAERLALF